MTEIDIIETPCKINTQIILKFDITYIINPKTG